MTASLAGREKLVAREELWRSQYRAKRYARLLTQEELNRRICHLMVNFVVLTREAKIAPLPLERYRVHPWLELLTHVIEEMRLRHGPYPNGYSKAIFAKEPFPDLVGELGKKAASVMHAKGLKRGETFIRYGRANFMTSLYERGTLRIQPASYFAAKDHNGAIRDDELSIHLSLLLTRSDVAQIVANPQDVPAVVADQRMDLTLNFGTDYWVYCLTESIEPRLFADFGADSCVIIRDREAFGNRIVTQAKLSLPDVESAQGHAVYVDPVLPRTKKIQIPFAKHFRYSYQEEYRFVWVPMNDIPKVSPIDIEIGPLAGIAELVTL